MTPSPSPSRLRRLRMVFHGAVQGVGFRPHVYRLANRHSVTGWVVSDVRGVVLEVEGDTDTLMRFADELRSNPPSRAHVLEVEEEWLNPEGFDGFAIRDGTADDSARTAILPDLALCGACRAEVTTPGGRRHGHPFTNCADCGPRFSIIRALPYDRRNTTMGSFPQCSECESEYRAPKGRRFRAPPNACPDCGPRLAWWNGTTTEGDGRDDREALARAVATLRMGKVVAVKGLGGFHLMVDATNEAAVGRLRERRAMEAKPLAVMVTGLDEASRLVELTPEDRALLASSAAPILLLPKLHDSPVAPSVAPGNPRVGVMLAYTPLHLLLLEAFGGPLVATSGSRGGEPICTDEEEARERLAGIADAFLVHDRPIQRQVDDSVLTPAPGGPQMIRRARGFAPFPLRIAEGTRPLLAVGGHRKSTVAVTRGREVWVSQHIGDLDTERAQDAFRRTVEDFLRLYRVEPEAVVHDLHPDYASTRWAESVPDEGVPRIAVQHHHAHMASVMAEAGCTADDTALGIIWDGVGLGTDGTIWGGEFLVGGMADYVRAGHLRPFRLPGGEAAVREPRRAALGLLLETGLLGQPGTDDTLTALSREEQRVLTRATLRGINAPWTTSAGRLLDALSSLLGLRHRARFEGDAAMTLEFAADPDEIGAYLMHPVRSEDRSWLLDWEPLVQAALSDRVSGVPVSTVAARIHNGLVDGMTRMADVLQQETVVLSGACFQNRRLLFRAHAALERQGHRVLLNRHVPPGDGGVSLGQVAVAATRLSRGPTPVPSWGRVREAGAAPPGS